MKTRKRRSAARAITAAATAAFPHDAIARSPSVSSVDRHVEQHAE